MTCETIRSIGLASATASIALALLSGCSSTAVTSGSRPQNETLAEGSVLVLLRPLAVPGDVWSNYFETSSFEEAAEMTRQCHGA